MTIRNKVKVTFYLDEECRYYLADAGLISMKTGKSLRFGDVSRMMNYLIIEKFNNTNRKVKYLKFKLGELNRERNRSDEETLRIVNLIRELKELEEKKK